METGGPQVHALVAEKREQILALCEKHKVRSLALFGSATTGEFDPDRSDLDFVVEFESPSLKAFVGLAEDLESLCGRKVDLVSARAIRNPFFQKTVHDTRVLLYEAA
ncbi:MAG: nucleotidyltransferase domain-containing protein [Dehalococcoidia bacterium]